MAKKKNVKPRNPFADAVRTNPAYQQRKVSRPTPRDYAPTIKDFDD